jgi:hypothetical protein
MGKRDDLDVVLEWLAKALFLLAWAGAIWNLNAPETASQESPFCVGSCTPETFHVPWTLTILAVCLSAALSGVVAVRQTARAKTISSMAARSGAAASQPGASVSGVPLTPTPPAPSQQNPPVSTVVEALPTPTEPVPAQTTAGPVVHPAEVVELKRARRNELYAGIGALGVVVQIIFAVVK